MPRPPAPSTPSATGPACAALAARAADLAAELREDHARYVAHWLGLLRGDRRAIFTAAGKAQAAADWLIAAAAGRTA